jgi:hypothetical protein
MSRIDHIITMGWPNAEYFTIILWFNNLDCFNGEACILSENEGTSSGKKKKKEKEKISDTPVYQPRFTLSEEITVDVPQDDNSTVTDAVTVLVQEDNNTMVTEVLKVPIPKEDTTTVTKAITIVAEVEESTQKRVQKKNGFDSD